MRLDRANLSAAMLLLFAGCVDGAWAQGASAPPRAAASPQATVDGNDAAAIADPAPGRVLGDIYGERGDGSASYALRNGRVVSFWYGRRFDLDGKRFYTGFADATPAGSGDAGQEHYPDPSVGVTIGQVTYVLDRAGGKPGWVPFHVQRSVGEFGGNERADGLDQKRNPQSYVTSDGRLVLAVPTANFINGVTLFGFALFAFDPGRNGSGDKGWAYLGTAASGEENGASCDDEDGPTKCVASTGTLAFEAPRSGAMPTLRVAMSGTAIAGPGKVRTLGAADTGAYVYDAARKQYAPPLTR